MRCVLKSALGVVYRLKHVIIVSEISSKVGCGRVKAPKELIFVEVCVVCVQPGVRVTGLTERELNW